nr:unnamed protein product [Digitaria exilis]
MEATLFMSPLSVFQAWYRKGMVNASLKNYSSAVRDLEVALHEEMTSLGKSNIEQELKSILQKQENIGEVGTSSCDSMGADLPLAGQPQKIIIESISTPNKGRGMTSTDDIPPASLVHVEDPMAAIIMKSSRETHCHFCFDEAPADIVFCPSCTIPIYCSKRCQEQAGGDISCNQDAHLEYNGHAMTLAKLSITSSCKSPSSKVFAEHRHECGGAHWAAVLPADIVLAGRIMAQYIEKRVLYGKNVSISSTKLDLVHHYDQHSPANKLESQIYAIVLLSCLQNHYGSELLWTEDSLSQAGEMHLPDRQKTLLENYYFSCQCSSCAELNLSDLVMNSFCCPQRNCLGAISESTYYRSKENFVNVSLGGSYVYKLSLPDISKAGKDMEKVARSVFGNSDAHLNIDPGCCMNCRSQIDVLSAAATSHREASKIDRLKEITLLDKTLIPEALQSLKQLKKLRHPYSKALAQAEDTIAEAFVKAGDQEQAQKHCEASIQILEKLYHSKHIAIAHELIKLVSVLLSLGDMAGAAATFARAEAIFSLYYGSHMEKILAYLGALRRAVTSESTVAC